MTIPIRSRACAGAGALLLLLAAPLRAQDAPPLTLADAYALAAEHNPMLQAAGWRTRAVAAMERSAALPPDPQVQLGVMNASLPGLRTDMPSSMAPSVQVMQMIPFPGTLALRARIARQETGIAEADAAEAGWMVRARVAMAFFEIYRADRQLAVMRETLDLLRTFQAVARAMYGAGEGRQADVLRAGVEVGRMEAEVARMEAMRAGAAARLNAVLGRPAETPVPAVALPPLPAAVPHADTLRAWAAETRPVLARGRLGVAQAGSRLDLARREVWPDLSVGVQYGQREAEMGTERMGSVMLGFTLPVFARQRQLRMAEAAAAMRGMAAAELSADAAEVDARVAELAAELARARTLARMYRAEVLPQADAAVQSALASYRVGQVDFMTLVDAQMAANQYRQELYALLADYGVAVAEMEMAVGRTLPVDGIPTLEEDR